MVCTPDFSHGLDFRVSAPPCDLERFYSVGNSLILPLLRLDIPLSVFERLISSLTGCKCILTCRNTDFIVRYPCRIVLHHILSYCKLATGKRATRAKARAKSAFERFSSALGSRSPRPIGWCRGGSMPLLVSARLNSAVGEVGLDPQLLGF